MEPVLFLGMLAVLFFHCCHRRLYCTLILGLTLIASAGRLTAPAFSAEPTANATAAATPIPKLTQPASKSEPPPATKASEAVTFPLRDDDAPPAKPHLALLLPLKSTSFRGAAETVKQGFQAAAEINPDKDLPIRIYPLENEAAALLAAYDEAVAAGATAVVAALTRDGATLLVKEEVVRLPTLALNIPEGHGPLPDPLYCLSLSLEGEARQVARLAFHDGKRKAIILTAATPLATRVQAAFEDEWQKLGAELLAQLAFSDEQKALAKFRTALEEKAPDLIFIAGDAAMARTARPHLGTGIAIYATSQLFDPNGGAAAFLDLQDIRFIDMPWLLQPEHPAVAIYPRLPKPLASQQERLYALGIDAYRLATLLASGSTPELADGVTGRITLTERHILERELTPAVIEEGGGAALATSASTSPKPTPPAVSPAPAPPAQ